MLIKPPGVILRKATVSGGMAPASRRQRRQDSGATAPETAVLPSYLCCTAPGFARNCISWLSEKNQNFWTPSDGQMGRSAGRQWGFPICRTAHLPICRVLSLVIMCLSVRCRIAFGRYTSVGCSGR